MNSETDVLLKQLIQEIKELNNNLKTAYGSIFDKLQELLDAIRELKN